MIARLFVFVLSIIVLTPNALAESSKNRFVTYFTDIESINPQMTNAQCQSIYADPIYYTIADNKTTYEPNKNLIITNYERLQKSPVDADHQLFLGKQILQLKLNNEMHQAENIIFFILDQKTHTISGGWYSTGYCKGLLNGKELGPN